MKQNPKLISPAASIAIHLILFLFLAMPALSLAAEPLVPCATSTNTKACGFNDLMTLVNNIINFILFYMAIPIAAVMFAYAGFLLVTAGGEAAHARTEAKNIFTNAMIGLVLAAGCWLIIKTLLSIVGYDGAWIGF